MTVLSDWEIRAHCEATQMVWPFRPDLLNPASLDVVLGDVLMVEMSGQKELEPYSISSATAENPYFHYRQQRMSNSIKPTIYSTIEDGRIVYYVKSGKEVKLFYRKEKAEQFAREKSIRRVV
jgi:hypothetical protein